MIDRGLWASWAGSDARCGCAVCFVLGAYRRSLRSPIFSIISIFSIYPNFGGSCTLSPVLAKIVWLIAGLRKQSHRYSSLLKTCTYYLFALYTMVTVPTRSDDLEILALLVLEIRTT